MAFSSLENRSFTSQATVGKKSPQEQFASFPMSFILLVKRAFLLVVVAALGRERTSQN